MKKILLTLFLVLSAAHAADSLPSEVTVQANKLQLNGSGVRTKLVFDVYRASLYVPQKTQQAEAVIQSDKPRRLVLQMLRNVEGKSMHEAMLEGLQKNSSAAELAAFAPQLQALSALFQQSLNQGDKVVLDFLPGKGVLISIKNQAPVAIASDAFGSALLKIWLGKKPADTGLKKALLGS